MGNWFQSYKNVCHIDKIDNTINLSSLHPLWLQPFWLIQMSTDSLFRHLSHTPLAHQQIGWAKLFSVKSFQTVIWRKLRWDIVWQLWANLPALLTHDQGFKCWLMSSLPKPNATAVHTTIWAWHREGKWSGNVCFSNVTPTFRALI